MGRRGAESGIDSSGVPAGSRELGAQEGLELHERLLVPGEGRDLVSGRPRAHLLKELRADVGVGDDLLDRATARRALAQPLHVALEPGVVVAQEVLHGAGVVCEPLHDALLDGRPLVARVRASDAENERVVEEPEVVDAVGNEVERLEDVVETGDQRPRRVVGPLVGGEQFAHRAGVFAEAAQPLGEHLEVSRIDGRLAHGELSFLCSPWNLRLAPGPRKPDDITTGRGENEGLFYIRSKARPRRNPATSAPRTRTTVSQPEIPRVSAPSPLWREPRERARGPSFDGSVSPNDDFGVAKATLAGASTIAGAAGLLRVPLGVRAGCGPVPMSSRAFIAAVGGTPCPGSWPWP